MHKLFLCCLALILLQSYVIAQITNPLRDYFTSRAVSPSGKVLYKWEVDLSHDGKKIMLLSSKPSKKALEQEAKDTQGNFDEYFLPFTVYTPTSKSSYALIKEIDNDGQISPGASLSIELNQTYVGYITQTKKWGLVTVEYENAIYTTDENKIPIIKNPARARIYAYTIEGNHLKKVTLADYNPDEKKNAIYEQYLTPAKRTKVELQEVTP